MICIGGLRLWGLQNIWASIFQNAIWSWWIYQKWKRLGNCLKRIKVHDRLWKTEMPQIFFGTRRLFSDFAASVLLYLRCLPHDESLRWFVTSQYDYGAKAYAPSPQAISNRHMLLCSQVTCEPMPFSLALRMFSLGKRMSGAGKSPRPGTWPET